MSVCDKSKNWISVVVLALVLIINLGFGFAEAPPAKLITVQVLVNTSLHTWVGSDMWK